LSLKASCREQVFEGLNEGQKRVTWSLFYFIFFVKTQTFFYNRHIAEIQSSN